MSSHTARIVQVFVLLILIIISDEISQYGLGQPCLPPDSCLLFSRCPPAIQQVRQRKHPQICWFEGIGIEPVVCCPRGNHNVEANPRGNENVEDNPRGNKNVEDNSRGNENVEDNPRGNENVEDNPRGNKNVEDNPRGNENVEDNPRGNKNVEDNPRGNENVEDNPRGNENVEDNPKPLFSSHGTKSKKKCEEYTKMKVEASGAFYITVVGGVKAQPEEFPHMAALGFGEANDTQWLCGGSLISEEYVLTTAHCIFAQKLGDLKFVRLGEINLKKLSKNVQNFGVALTIRNPGYTPPSRYNDIALVKLDRPVKFTAFVKPACLQTSFELREDLKPIATGWGRLAYTRSPTNDLMKVDLIYFNIEECKEIYANTPQNRLANGIDGDIQICAGGINESKDTCHGDSGGPLQIKTSDLPKQYSIVGITSFGKPCGVANISGVYTRVSSYIYWIEETVWPNS